MSSSSAQALWYSPSARWSTAALLVEVRSEAATTATWGVFAPGWKGAAGRLHAGLGVASLPVVVSSLGWWWGELVVFE
jgi:hypothetical protein